MKMDMENKKILDEVTYEVNNLLTEYIELHDKRLKSAGTFISLFKRTDFEAIQKDADILLQKFIKQNARLEMTKINFFFKKFNHLEKEFFNALYDYFSALFWTVQKLHKLTEKQYLRSQNKASLSLDNNMEMEKEYRKAEEAHNALAEPLQRQYERLQKWHAFEEQSDKTTESFVESLNKEMLRKYEHLKSRPKLS